MEKFQFINQDKWLSEIMNKNVFSMNIDLAMLCSESFVKKSLPKTNSFIFCKVPVSKIGSSIFLEKLGFYIVDTQIQMNKKSKAYKKNIKQTRFVSNDDRVRVVEIAKNNFVFSRFHLDPSIDNSMANLIKEKWVDNYFNGLRGDYLIVKDLDSLVIGFLLIIKKGKDFIIDLIAVDSNYQKLGGGSDMILCLESLFDQEATIIVGTQAANIPSICLYQKHGFRINNSSYIFHYHS